jgi:hypothetical protein
MANRHSSDTPTNKVAQVIERREMEQIAEQLESMWLGRNRSELSVREITDEFNKRVLEDSLSQAGMVPLEGEIQNIYQLLSNEENDSAASIQARDKLNAADIDTDGVENDFVSHQTMYRFLKNVRGVQKENSAPSIEDKKRSAKNAVQKLQGRLRTVIRSNLDDLSKRDGFHLGEFDVTISVTISCRNCGVSKNLLSIMDENGCDCD